MTGNIVGEEFEDYVFDQIGLRQSTQGKGLNSTRTPQDLQYLTNNNSWIKLASSVNIEDNYGIERLGKIISSQDAEKYRGYNLSKSSVLFNGLSALEGTNYTQRSGIVENSNNIWSSNLQYAYGLGGSDFGLQPMPGVIEASVKTLNRGSIRKAQVTIKAFNRFQFEIIELLYLRLGFTMMLEWGNRKYLSSDGTVKDVGNTLIEESWFTNEGITQLEMLTKIEKKREAYSGNYDGFFGKVSNFNWSFESDGSYNIILDLITLGDVIESLTANDPLSSYTINQITQKKKENNILGDLADSSIVESAENNIISAWLFTSVGNDKLWGTDNDYPDYFNLLNTVNDPKYNIPKQDIKIKPQYSYYVTFQELLNKINEFIVPEIDNNNKKSPILGIYNSEINNYVNYFPNQYSTDPRVCIVKPVFGRANIEDFEYPSYFEPLKNYVGIEDQAIYGQLMNIYLNFDFISKCITSSTTTSDNTTKISLYSFLERLCDGINNSLGGVNKIEPIINEDYYITFIDQIPIPGLVKDRPKKSIVDLEVYGYNKENNTSNFVKSINFQTKITPDLATQITIGATANGSSVKNEDSTAFSKWSEGLVDRFNQKYTEPLPKDLMGATESNWVREVEEKFNKYPEVKVREKVTRRDESGKTFYRGAEIKQGKYQIKRTVDLFEGKEQVLNLGQFQAKYLNYQISLKSKNILTQSEFNTIYTTDWSFYISECFAGEIAYKVDLGERVVSSTFKNPNAVTTGFDTRSTQMQYKSKTTKTITSDAHRYLHFDPSFIARANNVYKSYLISFYKNLYNKQTNSTPSPLSGFIPVSFNLTTQGISGIKIYNKLNINQNFLPKQYPEALKFLITGVDHKISNNSWETNLTTLSVPSSKPLELEEFVNNVSPSLIDYGIGFAKPNNSKEFIIKANIQTSDKVTTGIDALREGIDFYKIAIFSDTFEGYRNVTIDETLELFSVRARSSFRNFFNELARDYKGYTLYVNEVKRTFEESQRIYDKQIQKLNSGESTFEPAEPGTSYHNFGLAIDMNIQTPQGNFLTSKDPTGWREHALDRVAKNNGIEWGVANDYVHFWYKG